MPPPLDFLEVLMLRGMVFVDHMNFDITLKSYYKTTFSSAAPKLDYSKLFPNVVGLVPNVDYLKTFIFVPKPDEFLMKDPKLAKYYKWAMGLKSSRYIDVIEGRYVSRPTVEGVAKDISDHNSYYKVEKGTDINLAINALGMAYSNAYDVAFVMSGDTDYISIYKQLKNLGKIVVVVGLKGQKLNDIIPEVDDVRYLDDDFFQNCLRSACVTNQA